MPRAFNLLRPDNAGPIYRRESFGAGLAAVGYDVHEGPPEAIEPGDALLIWSRYNRNHELACEFEATPGCRVFVAENGYIGPGGASPHHTAPREWYALGLGAHNDSTVLPAGGGERWAALGIDVKPRRPDGPGHVLVCPNRSFGRPGRIMPTDWPEATEERLRAITKREVRLRLHPGNRAPAKPLAQDLAGAHCVVIWSSSAGVHALVAGVPVLCEAPYWICKPAAGAADELESPPMPERLPAFEGLARGQWHLSEIENGHAFRALLAA